MREDLLQKYSESLSPTYPGPYIRRATMFLKWLGDREFNKENVLKYIAHLKKDPSGFADSTIRHDFGIIRRLAIVNNLPWNFKREEKPEVREIDIYTPALDPVDIKAMVDCVRGLVKTDVEVRPEHATFLALSTVYGLRRIEMVEIEPRFVDISARSIFIQTAKGGRQRYHLIPENILPYLAVWDFHRRFSKDGMRFLFQDLKAMIGLTADEVSWHSIRRSAVAEAWRCGLTAPDINSFYRWKRPMSDMALRYATAKIVGRAGEHADVPYGDKVVDEAVFKVHPFVRFWD